MKIEDIWDSENQIPIGLKIKCSIASSNLEQAVEYVAKMVSGVVLLIAYLSSTGIPAPRIEKIYEVTPGANQGIFKSYHYGLPLPVASLRSIEKSDLSKIINKAGELKSNEFQRFFRALHWYNTGILSDDVVDKFTSMWISFENLNKLLIDYYSVQDEPEKCPTCGRTSTTMLPGVKHLIETVFEDPDAWKRIRTTRVWIVHGTKGFSEIVSEVTTLLPKMEKFLNHALDALVKPEHREERSLIPLSTEISAISIVDGIIEGPDISQVDTVKEPAIDLKVVKSTPMVDPRRKLPRIGTKLELVPTISIAPDYSLRITNITQNVREHVANRTDIKLNYDHN